MLSDPGAKARPRLDVTRIVGASSGALNAAGLGPSVACAGPPRFERRNVSVVQAEGTKKTHGSALRAVDDVRKLAAPSTSGHHASPSPSPAFARTAGKAAGPRRDPSTDK